MGQLAIVDDSTLEVACVVDVDEFTTLGIVAAGPVRTELLRAFIDAVPFDLALMPHPEQREAFVQFLERYAPAPESTPATPDQPTPGPADGQGDDAGPALAEREAIEHTDTPELQPADTDTPAPSDTPSVTVKCFNCGGSGRVEVEEGQPSQECNTCRGLGTLVMATAA